MALVHKGRLSSNLICCWTGVLNIIPPGVDNLKSKRDYLKKKRKRTMFKRISERFKAAEKWLLESNNPTFWKLVVLGICKFPITVKCEDGRLI